jgi:hypothetical protein
MAQSDLFRARLKPLKNKGNQKQQEIKPNGPQGHIACRLAIISMI